MEKTTIEKDLKKRIRHLEKRVKVLEETKNFYRAFFEHSLYGAVILDPVSLCPVEFNDQVCRQLGYTRDEFAQLNLSEIEANETREETRTHIQKVIEKGFDDFETLQRTKQGELRNVHVLSQVINAGNRQVYHCIWRDITEKKLAEEQSKKAIRESEKKFRSITENAVDCIFIKDKHRKYTFVNKAMEMLFDLPPHKIIGKKPEAIFSPDQAAIVKKVDDRTFSGESVNETISLIINGKEYFFNTTQTPLDREGGNVTTVMGIARDVTEQKMAEISLFRSEQKWRNILVNTPQIGISLDSEGRIVFANNRFLQLTGWSQKEVLGADWFDMFVPETIREDIRGIFWSVVSKKETSEFSSYENDIVLRNGELRRISWSNVLTKDAQGEIVDVTCLGIDLTERQRSDKELKESEEKYRLLVENQSDMVVKVDTTGRFLFVSPSYCRTFGKTEEDLLDQQFMPLVHEDDQAPTAKAMETLYVPPYSAYIEQRAMTKDGWRWLAWADTAVLDEVGNVKEIIGVGRDITKRKNVENAVKQSEHKFRSLFDLSPQAIALTEIETGKLIDVNQKLCELAHYTKEEIVGKTTIEIGLYSYRERQRFINELKKSGQVNGLEMNFKAKDGSEFITLMFAGLIKVSGESLIITILHDITAQKKLETVLQRAQKMESIGNLSGGIAHDFNNILFPIVGMSEMLMQDFPADSPEYSSANAIFNAAMRGKDLVKQILAFSRQSEHKLIPVRPQQILKEVINLTRSTIPTSIDVKADIQHDCGLVMADPTQLHQVAMNLITNAFHALEPTGGTLSVTLKETELRSDDLPGFALEPGKFAQITVSDTGCGIDPSLMDKIFEPYFTTKEKDKGTGLGLAVVYGIVKEHRGEIKIYSELGKGTTIEVFLPLMKKFHGSVHSEIQQTIETGTGRILLVDDETPIANVEKQMLERLGYQVTMRVNSVEALKAFSAKPNAFDLVISDITMPNMTGDQLARELIAIRSDIPVIICTGFSDRLNEEEASTIGIKGFLMKPIVITEMAKMVRTVLDEAKKNTHE